MSYLLHDVFKKSVKKTPNNIAIITEFGSSISYAELNKLSNKFANYFSIIKGDRKNNPFVGILSPVHINSIAAVLGILNSGFAYVPLDDQSPPDRLIKIINNCNMDVIAIDPHYYEKYKLLFDIPSIKKFIFLDHEKHLPHPKRMSFNELSAYSDQEPNKINQVSDDLAYVLHSSGSTGIPKGIMLTHRNARTFVDWMHKEFQLSENDKIMSRAPFKFDLSVFDIFNTFKAGAKVICYDWNYQRHSHEQHKSYADLMVKERATMLYTTPSTFIALMNHGNLLENKDKLSLRTIMYAGEPFQIPQLIKLKQILPATKIANIYGPTETNIITYYWINDISDKWPAIPLGVEVDDTEIIVVNEEGTQICNANEIGELWCRGGTVTLGYLGMDEKTKECQVLSPFHPYPAIFWRTGDFGFRDNEGILHYKCRKDHMVKVKGYRIEIGEIETALAKYNGLDEYAVVACKDEKLNNRLFCFYSELTNTSSGEIKQFLLNNIPEYMVPYKFIPLSTLPKTSSGKIDRIRLAESIAHE